MFSEHYDNSGSEISSPENMNRGQGILSNYWICFVETKEFLENYVVHQSGKTEEKKYESHLIQCLWYTSLSLTEFNYCLCNSGVPSFLLQYIISKVIRIMITTILIHCNERESIIFITS